MATRYLKIGNLYTILPQTVKLEPRPFMGLKAFENPEHPHLTRPPGANLYQMQLEFFWLMSDEAPHESYQAAWLYNGMGDPLD